MMRDSETPKSLWAKPIAALAAFGLAVLTAMSVLLGGSAAAAGHGPAAVAVSAGDEIRLAGCSIPGQAWQTLKLIDAGQWPPNDGSGTKGGTTWDDREGTLPRTGANGPIHYREWDVNRKQPGQSRDAQRIVTGDNGTAYYTGDHYATFCQMR
ncbi:ribonuclease domain-containing protein [Nocardia terpenica]|nr:ribonuclease domain-containing protein [Nocardia terpenica]